jgi:hypothetical protein
VDHDDRDDGCGRTGPGRADVPAAQALEIAARNADAAAEANSLSLKTHIADQRPWLFVSDVEIADVRLGDGHEEGRATLWITVSLKVQNSGKTPALSVQIDKSIFEELGLYAAERQPVVPVQVDNRSPKLLGGFAVAPGAILPRKEVVVADIAKPPDMPGCGIEVGVELSLAYESAAAGRHRTVQRFLVGADNALGTFAPVLPEEIAAGTLPAVAHPVGEAVMT